MGYLAVDSDAGGEDGKRSDGYGTLRLLEITDDTTVPGPGQVQNTFDSDPVVAEKLNVLTIGKSEVAYGNLLTLPVGGGLLYVQPVYVQSADNTQVPKLRKVLVAFGGNVAFEDTLTAALDALFGGEAGAAGGDGEVEPTNPDEGGTTPPDDGTTPPPSDAEADALAAAAQALSDRDAELKAGDLAAFAEADKRLTEAVETLIALDDAAGE
jgi:uncharacterized membrane protein (UPF0182 family)